jgi:hypothetical protein
MDEMGTPGPNHPAHRGLSKVQPGQFDNVLDLSASRKIKEKTGQAVPVKKTSGDDSPSLIKHENEAMALGNPVPKKKSTIERVTDYLGLN